MLLQGTDVLHVAGIAAVIYGFMDPADKKSLSQTCKTMRKVYIETYFPAGLVLAPMKLSVDASWSRNGEASLRRKCGADGCTRRTSPTVNILGMKTPTKIGMLTHCGRPACRDEVVKKSYERAIVALVADGGSATHFSRSAYYSLMERCLAVCRSGLVYSRIRTAHDLLISAMMKQAMSSDKSEYHWASPWLVLEASVTTPEILCKSSDFGTKLIFVSVGMDVCMSSSVPRAPTPAQPINLFAPTTTATTFDFTPALTPASAPPALLPDEPTPMVY